MPDHPMGSNAAESMQVLNNSLCVKAHSSLCLELTKVLDKVVCILPAIESARPGCTSGIQELCSLSNTIGKAKLLIQHCTECSKFYLAITGESIVLRCERIRSSLNQSLQEVHNMVPEVLATQILDVLEYIRDVRFIIDPTEEEAGKAMLELLGQTDSSEELELKTFEIAAVSLNITSPKSFLAERRSIKKLLDKIHGSDSKKERILNYFLYLIKKYGKKVKTDVGGCRANFSSHEKCLIAPKSNNVEHIDQSTNHGETRTELSTADVPPEEFCCPISSRLMYDPVVISSGQTFERVSIEKWFSEGHDTCPKTKMKLTDLCMIPNSCMKDLIFNWGRTHGIKLEDPSTPFQCWEPSYCSSISSLKNVSATLLDGNSRDYMLQSDNSNVSFISSDTSYCSDSSYAKGINSLKDNSHSQFFSWSNDYLNCQSFSDFSHDTYLRFFYGLCELPSDLQAKAVEKLKFLLPGDDEICYAMLSNGFLESLMTFLRNAHSISDVHAQRTGAQIFLAFLNNLRVDIPSLGENVHQLLTSLLNRFHHPEIILEALMILRKLSRQQNSNIVSVSGLPQSVIKLLDFEDHVVLESALEILCDLSLHKELRSHIIASECIPKVVTLLSDKRLAELCLKVLHNLSDIKEAAALIAETNGCISSIAELLDCGSREEQTYGAAIFRSLCSYSLDYCLLILKEGVIPSLVHISVNGNAKGKENAMKLLHIFRDLRLSGGFDSLEPPSEPPSTIALEDCADHPTRKQANSKSSGFFGRKMRFFSKPRTLALS